VALGTVKCSTRKKGYGFIQPQGGGKDVFVHISAVEKAGLSGLNDGQAVEYEEVPNKGKTSAEHLKLQRGSCWKQSLGAELGQRLLECRLSRGQSASSSDSSKRSATNSREIVVGRPSFSERRSRAFATTPCGTLRPLLASPVPPVKPMRPEDIPIADASAWLAFVQANDRLTPAGQDRFVKLLIEYLEAGFERGGRLDVVDLQIAIEEAFAAATAMPLPRLH